MIKLETIVNSLSNSKERPYKLPDGNRFTQRTAYQIKIEELEHIMSSSNSEIDQYVNTKMNITGNITNSLQQSIKTDLESNNNKSKITNTPKDINNDIIFNEDEILDIPEVISCLFKNSNQKTKSQLNKKEYYLYGIKNRDSFYNALVLLTQTDYIIKTKSEKNGLVVSFKRELGLKLETAFNQFDYKELKFKKNKMVTDLMNDHNLDFSLQIASIDYIKHDVCIININTKSYMYLKSYYIDNPILTTFYIVLNINDNYVPIMNSSGKHLFNEETLNLIKGNFEKGVCEKPYKERLVIKPQIHNTENLQNTEITENIQNEEQPELNLKALSSYKLKALQELSIKYNINIKKNMNNKKGNGKMKNKTKEELYNELSV
jgi:RNA polymerase-interacting CarD/CdnL/TRCF family regulator